MNTAHPVGEKPSSNRSQEWTPRYGLYFTPPQDSVWTQVWSRWLGRCAYSGEMLEQPVPPTLDAGLMSQLTAEPARYGFHATLKAPFHLAPGARVAELERMLIHFCEAQQGFLLPPVDAVLLDDFLALRLSVPHAPVERIAAACVRQFDRLRAPPADAEIARRRTRPLSASQLALCERWGYPYVFNEFRFHFTLSGPLTAVRSAAARALMRDAHLQVAQMARHPLRFDAISVFEQLSPGAPFQVRLRAPLS